MELTRDDSGSRRSVRVGERVVVALDEVATSGYRWEPDVDPARLRALPQDTADAPTQPRGGSRRAVFAFEALQPGPARLRLVLKRPWETEPIDELAVDLDVTSG
jgi:predicted secreted protein